jgi:hypothetical protein
MGYKAVPTVAGLAGVIVATVVITLAIERRAPTFTTVGTGVVAATVSLHREPSESASKTGTLNVGESVELLQYLPSRSMDSWALLRSAQDQKIYGYAPLSNIENLETSSDELDIWHATQLVQKATTAELRERLATIDEKLKTPLPASPATDQIYRTLAAQSVRLANGSADNKDEARAAIEKAKSYLSRISSVAPETEEIRLTIQQANVALAETAEPAAIVAAAAPSPKSQLSRLMKDATAAFSSGRYAKAAELSEQVAAKGQGKRELASIVEQAKALQKKAETAQEEYEKVNIQNR